METKNKVIYEAPAVNVVVVKAESVICSSPISSATRTGYGAADEDNWD